MTFNAVAAEWLFRLFYNNRVNDFMIRNLRRQKRCPIWKIIVCEFDESVA